MAISNRLFHLYAGAVSWSDPGANSHTNYILFVKTTAARHCFEPSWSARTDRLPNIATVAGALGLNWIVDGMQDGTPPGGALLFELWRSRDGNYSVRLYYTAQSLDQMRNAQKLTAANPPERVPVFIPGCSGSNMACSLADFRATVRRAIIPVRPVQPE